VFSCVLQVFQMYVCKCFSFWTQVASVSSGCCKSNSSVAHVTMGPTCCNHPLRLLGRHRGSPCGPLRLAEAYAACIHKRGRNWDLGGHKQRGKRSRRERSPRICVRKRSGAGGPHAKQNSCVCMGVQQARHPNAGIRQDALALAYP
jgi:hypothetical protein